MNDLSVLSGTVVAAVFATFTNVVLLLIGRQLVGTPEDFAPLSMVPVLLATLVGCAGAGLIFWLVRRLSSHPDTAFTMIAFVALVVSFTPDVLLKQASTGPFAGATWAAVVLLMLMHTVVAGTVLYIFLHMVASERS